MPTQSGYGYVEGYSDIQKFTDIPIPTPKGNEVLLKVEAAGLCLSDPHVLIAGPIESKPPIPLATKFVMGHEIAGSVSAVGEQLVNDPNYKKVLDLLYKLLKLVECVIHVVKDMMVFVI